MKQLNFLSLVSDNVSGMHRDWTGNGPALPRKLFTLLFCLLLGFGQMWGTTYTLGWGDASGAEGTYTNFNSASGSVTNLVSFSTAKNSAGNAPATGSNPNTLRMYYASNGSGGSVTLTPATGVTITGFSINTTTNPTTKYKVGSGSLTTISLSGSSSNYSGSVSNLSVTSSSSITIQNCNTSNTQLRIKTITITYTAAASCTDPSILLSISSSNTATYGIDKTLETSGGNNGTVTWTVANGTGSATVSGNTLHPTSVGTVTVTATQDDNNGKCGKVVNQTITISKASASISLEDAGSGSTPSGTFYGGDSYTLPTTAATCTGKVLVGWSTVEILTEGDKPTSNYNAKGTAVTLSPGTNTFYAVYANSSSEGEDTYVLVSSASNFEDGTYVAAALDGGTYYFVDGNAVSAGIGTESTGLASASVDEGEFGVSSLPSGAVELDIVDDGEPSGTNHYYYISYTNGDDTYYLDDNGTKQSLNWVADADDSYHPNFSANGGTDGCVLLSSSGAKVSENSTTRASSIRNYASTGNYYRDIYFFKKNSSTTYSNYATFCCSPLGSINGSVSKTHNTATLTWDKKDNVTWEVTYKADGGSVSSANVTISDADASHKQAVITDLSSNTHYEFYVRAYNATGYCETEKTWTLDGTTDPSWTITESANEDLYGEVSRDGSTITGTPAQYCRYASPAFTLTGTATVTQGTGENINKFYVTGQESDITVVINFEPIPVTGVTMSSNAETLEYNGTVTLTATVDPNTVNPNVTWTSSDETVATVDGGVVTATQKAGTTTITATSVGDGTKTATCTVTVVPVAYYKKVTTELDDWSGEYLLVYEPGDSKARVWTGVDYTNCYDEVDIPESGKIAKPATGVKLVLEALTGDNEGKYSIKIVGGTNNSKYLDEFNTSNANIKFTENAVPAELSYDETNHSTQFTTGNKYMRYNKAVDQKRFRGYASNGQEPVQLYRKVATSAVTITAPAEETGSLTLADGLTPVASGDNIDAGTQLTVTATPNGDNHYIGGTIAVKKTSDGIDVPNTVWDGTTLTMPEYAITVSATFTPTYQITQSGSGGSIAWEANTESGNLPAYFAAGTEVIITANADNTHTFTSLSLSNNVENPDIDGNVAMFSMPASAVTATVVFTEKVDPSIAITDGEDHPITALNFGTPKKGDDVPAAQTFVIFGANLKGALTVVSSAPSLYAVSYTEGALTPDANKEVEAMITVTAQEGITDAAGTKSANITISGEDLTPVVITASMTVQETYTVNWWINGGENPASSVTDVEGTEVTAPSDFSSFTDCSDFHFIGWATSAVADNAGTTTKPDLVTPISAIGTTATTNYYAVFAEGTPAGTKNTVATLDGSKMQSHFTSSQVAYTAAEASWVDSEDGITWSARFNCNANTPWMQLKNDNAVYFKIDAAQKITKVEIKATDASCSGSGCTMRFDDHGNCTNALSLRPTSTITTAVASGTPSNKELTLVPTGTNSTLYLTAAGTARIWEVKVTYSEDVPEDFSKYYTTCPHVKRVNLSAAEVSNGSISFEQSGSAVTNVRTDGGADVDVDVVPDPATGYELTDVALSGTAASKASYDAGVITIEAGAEGTLTATATFSQKNYSISVVSDPASIGATLGGVTSTAKYGVEQTISTDEPTGYLFGGWYLFDASTFEAEDIDWSADLSPEIFTGTYEGNDLVMNSSFLMPDKNLVAVAAFDKVYTPAEALALTDLSDSVYVEGIISQVDEVSTQYKNATYYISADGTTTNQIKIYRGKHLNNGDVTTGNAGQIAVGNKVIVRGKLSQSSNVNQFGQGASYITVLVEKTLSALTIVGDASVTTYDVGDSFDKTGLSLSATYNTGYVQANYTGTTITSNYDAPTTFTTGVTSVTVSAEEGLISTSRDIEVTVSSAVLDHVVISADAQTEFWAKEQYKEPLLDAYLTDEPATVLHNVTGVSNTTGLDMSVTGNKSVTVTYTRKVGQTDDVTYNFTVKPIAVDEANAHSVATAREIIDLDNDASEDLDLELAANKTHVIGVVTSVSALTGANAGKYTIVIKDQTDAAKVMTLYQVTLKSGVTSVEAGDVIKAYGNLYYHSQSSKYEINTGGEVVWKQPKVGITIANKTLEVGDVWTIDATIDPAAAPVTYSIKDGSDDCITLATNVITATAEGTATIIAHANDYEEYMGNEKEFTVTVNPAATHTNVVILAEYSGKYYALNNEAGTTTVEMKDGIVYVPDATTKNAIIWDRAERNGVATFKNGAANKYLQGGNSTTLGTQTATTAENSTQWTWTETATKSYYTANPGESTVRSFLYQSGQGIKNYAVSNIGVNNYAQANALAVQVGIKLAPEGEDPVTKDEDDVPSNTSVIVAENVTLEINNAKTLDNLTVEAGGNLALTAGENKKLTVNDMTIKSEAGQSGQVSGTNVQVSGDIYLEIKLDASGTLNPQKYYCISAPFAVAAFEWGNGSPMVFNVDYQLFKYDGAKRASTGNGWQRVGGTMEANTAYFIVFDNTNLNNQNTIRLKAANKAIPTAASMHLDGHDSEISGSNDWYGLGNPALHYVGLNKTAHVFDCEVQGYDVIPHWSTDFDGFVVGSAFFVQVHDEDLTFNNSASAYHAPKRQADEYTYCVEIAKEGANRYDNRIFVRASEDAASEFVQGKDEITLNGETSNYGALIWTKNYGMRLAVEGAPMVNDKATYALGIYAPKAGTYTISVAAPKDNATLYLTKNGYIIWNLTMSECEVDLTQGQNNEYGLVLRAGAPQVSTGVDTVNGEGLMVNGVQKIIIDEQVFILRGEQLYGIDGKMVK